MNALHTSGPWTVIPAKLLGTPGYEPAKVCTDGRPFLLVATVEFPVHNVSGEAIEIEHPATQQHFNARLIAAAPELLAALLLAQEQIWRFDGESGSWHDANDAINAAIAKATGSA